MQRVISVYLPSWPTDRLARSLGKNAPPPDAPLVMIARVGRRRAIAALNGPAQESGLRIGQAIAHATALVPGLRLVDLTPEDDQAALHRLALWAQRRYSPTVAVDGADGLVIDATGAAHLFGGEEKMLIDLQSRLDQAGYGSCLAIADTWGAASAMARFGTRRIWLADPGRGGRDIGHLPIAALRLPAVAVEALGSLGFETIAELEATPKGPLARRLGLAPVRRLDQALGREPEPIEPVLAPETTRTFKIFAEPIGAPETLERYTTALVADLCAKLEDRGLGARRIDAFYHRVDHRTETSRIAMASPSRDAKRLARLLCERLETVDPGFGVERIELTAPDAEILEPAQQTGLSAGEAEADVTALIDTLANRLGAENVYRLGSKDSDLPERSVVRLQPHAGIPPSGWPIDWPRPSRLLRRPEPIETVALLPDAPPASFTWQGVRRRVRCADGPERVFGEWWRRDEELAIARDYFQIEDEDGRRYWIFREGDGIHAETGSMRWWIHGLFG